MSNGKGLAVTGLILGLIGAGLGGYVFYNTTLAPILGLGEPPLERNTFYAEDDITMVNTTWTYVPLPNINVNFTTTKTMKLHVLFTCYVRIDPPDGDKAYLHIYLDEQSITSLSYYIDAAGTDAEERFAVNMQAYNNSLPPGTYNITVRVMIDDPSTRFYVCSLFVDTYT